MLEEVGASRLCQIVNGPLALTAITSSVKVESAGGEVVEDAATLPPDHTCAGGGKVVEDASSCSHLPPALATSQGGPSSLS